MGERAAPGPAKWPRPVAGALGQGPLVCGRGAAGLAQPDGRTPARARERSALRRTPHAK
jgi:hypothetical protein